MASGCPESATQNSVAGSGLPAPPLRRPAVLTTNRSPRPRSKMISVARRKSEQPNRTATAARGRPAPQGVGPSASATAGRSPDRAIPPGPRPRACVGSRNERQPTFPTARRRWPSPPRRAAEGSWSCTRCTPSPCSTTRRLSCGEPAVDLRDPLDARAFPPGGAPACGRSASLSGSSARCGDTAQDPGDPDALPPRFAPGGFHTGAGGLPAHTGPTPVPPGQNRAVEELGDAGFRPCARAAA